MRHRPTWVGWCPYKTYESVTSEVWSDVTRHRPTWAGQYPYKMYKPAHAGKFGVMPHDTGPRRSIGTHMRRTSRLPEERAIAPDPLSTLTSKDYMDDLAHTVQIGPSLPTSDPDLNDAPIRSIKRRRVPHKGACCFHGGARTEGTDISTHPNPPFFRPPSREERSLSVVGVSRIPHPCPKGETRNTDPPIQSQAEGEEEEKEKRRGGKKS
ncbi:hypothetical protein BHE74_00026221 [Ensete ventricosum]|nr:hypothetical protein BHE74_00026221 [Ensete ventricosum]